MFSAPSGHSASTKWYGFPDIVRFSTDSPEFSTDLLKKKKIKFDNFFDFFLKKFNLNFKY